MIDSSQHTHVQSHALLCQRFGTSVPFITSVTIQNQCRRMPNCKHVEIVEFGGMYETLISVNIQTFTGASDVWFSLNGTTYQNNSCVTLEDIGVGDNGLRCKTNLTACCKPPYTGENGSAMGNWFFPNGTKVPSAGAWWDFHRTRGHMVVLLHRTRGGEEGIYHCEIPDSRSVTQTIYIGLYSAGNGE